MSVSHRNSSHRKAAGRLDQALKPARALPAARHRSAGVSLVECCISLAILGILVTAAAPAAGGLLQSQWDKRLAGLGVAQLQSSLNIARSEAIKSNGRSVVCKSNDGRQCTSEGTWSQGWIVFRDDNNNAQRDEGEALVAAVDALAQKLRIEGNTPVARYVSFQPDGSPAATGGAFQAGTFTICRAGSAAAAGQQIVLSATGRTRQQASAPTPCA